MFRTAGFLLQERVLLPHWKWYTDFSPHTQFAPLFGETFRPPTHTWERRFAPAIYIGKMCLSRFHILERRFAP